MLQSQNQNRNLGSSTSKANKQPFKTGYSFLSQLSMGSGPLDFTNSMGGVEVPKLSIFNGKENLMKHKASYEQ